MSGPSERKECQNAKTHQPIKQDSTLHKILQRIATKIAERFQKQSTNDHSEKKNHIRRSITN